MIRTTDMESVYLTMTDLGAAFGASRRSIASDVVEDAIQNVMETVLADPDSDRTREGLALALGRAIERERGRVRRIVAGTAERASRSDETTAVPWETLTASDLRASMARLTAGDTLTMSEDHVRAIAASHSGVADIAHRSTRARFTAARKAARAVAHSEPIDAATLALVSPGRADPDSKGRRTVGARWSRVSTAGGPFREIRADLVGTRAWSTRSGSLRGTHGTDEGAVAGIRHRDSDIGNGAENLRLVHSAESAFHRDAWADSLRDAFSECAPTFPNGRPSEYSAVDAFTFLASSAERSQSTIADLLANHASDPRFTRKGRRISGARIAWSDLAADIGAPTDQISARTLARAVTTYGRQVARLASDTEPSYSTPLRASNGFATPRPVFGPYFAHVEWVPTATPTDRGVSVISDGPAITPTARVGTARGLTDPRYGCEPIDWETLADDPRADGNETEPLHETYRPTSYSQALRIEAKGWGDE